MGSWKGKWEKGKCCTMPKKKRTGNEKNKGRAIFLFFVFRLRISYGIEGFRISFDVSTVVYFSRPRLYFRFGSCLLACMLQVKKKKKMKNVSTSPHPPSLSSSTIPILTPYIPQGFVHPHLHLPPLHPRLQNLPSSSRKTIRFFLPSASAPYSPHPPRPFHPHIPSILYPVRSHSFANIYKLLTPVQYRAE